MDLKAYFTERDSKLTRDGAELQRIALETGCTPYYLFMIAAGHKKAGAVLARNISRATNFIVPPSAIRHDYFGPMPKDGEAA